MSAGLYFPLQLVFLFNSIIELMQTNKRYESMPPPPPATWPAITELIYIGHIVSFWFATVNMPFSAHPLKTKKIIKYPFDLKNIVFNSVISA